MTTRLEKLEARYDALCAEIGERKGIPDFHIAGIGLDGDRSRMSNSELFNALDAGIEACEEQY